MIKLSANYDRFDSGYFSHPSLAGSAGNSYVFNHMRGRRPDDISLSFEYSGSSTADTTVVPRSIAGTQYNGWDMYADQTPDTTTIRVFRVINATIDLRVELFWF